MINCDEYHEKCSALCCRSVGFVFDKLTKEQIEYHNMHEGMIVVERKIRDKWWYLVLVKTECKHLNEDWRCAVWDTDRLPQVCKDGYNKIKRGVTFIPGCRNPPGTQSYVLTEEDVAELLKDGK